MLWSERALNHGDEEAITPLAQVVFAGDLDQDCILTLPTLFGSAADNGNADAIFALGLAYRDGRRVEQDKAKAAQLFVKAGGAGCAEGYVEAAVLYMTGDGVRHDPAWVSGSRATSVSWFTTSK